MVGEGVVVSGPAWINLHDGAREDRPRHGPSAGREGEKSRGKTRLADSELSQPELIKKGACSLSLLKGERNRPQRIPGSLSIIPVTCYAYRAVGTRGSHAVRERISPPAKIVHSVWKHRSHQPKISLDLAV